MPALAFGAVSCTTHYCLSWPWCAGKDQGCRSPPAALSCNQSCPTSCHNSCHRVAARSLLCGAWTSCSPAPGWWLGKGETLVIPLLGDKPILTAMEGSSWDKLGAGHQPEDNFGRKANSYFFTPMSRACGSSTALGLARNGFILAYVTVMV